MYKQITLENWSLDDYHRMLKDGWTLLYTGRKLVFGKWIEE